MQTASFTWLIEEKTSEEVIIQEALCYFGTIMALGRITFWLVAACGLVCWLLAGSGGARCKT